MSESCFISVFYLFCCPVCIYFVYLAFLFFFLKKREKKKRKENRQKKRSYLIVA